MNDNNDDNYNTYLRFQNKNKNKIIKSLQK